MSESRGTVKSFKEYEVIMLPYIYFFHGFFNFPIFLIVWVELTLACLPFLTDIGKKLFRGTHFRDSRIMEPFQIRETFSPRRTFAQYLIFKHFN